MILQSLNRYYERLEADDAVDIAPYGFSRQKISFCVTLNQDGTLHSIDDIREPRGNRTVPKSLLVCGNAKPPGSGINPCFLWDNSAYLLGYKADDPKPLRTQEAFEAFRQRHLAIEEAIGDAEFSTVCRFLEKWQPSASPNEKVLVELGTGFGVFRLRGADHFVHDRTRIKQWWKSQLTTNVPKEKPVVGQCLVTGNISPLARLHEPKIKGVLGAQSAGATIVSFNLDAFNSYGKEQGLNSPISESAAFQYCTALNHLLREGSPQRIQIGDATTVFWTEKPTNAENLLPWVFEPNRASENEALKSEIRYLLERIKQGEYPNELGSADTQFYLLGLSPNAARISVRFWLESSLNELVRRLHQHFEDLSLAHRETDPDFPAVWQLIRETVRESKDIPPSLGGAVMRSVLTGAPYPSMLFGAIIRRIRADRDVRYLRVAVLKASLNRNTRLGIDPLEKELSMTLDPTRAEPAYQLGRLFAELEKTQEDALPGINDTIKDRYFGAASATPGSVFPRLIRLSQHHLGKLEKRLRIYHERRIQEITATLDGFASHLNLRDQGLFAVGYYHHRHDLFTKKTEPETSNTEH